MSVVKVPIVDHSSIICQKREGHPCSVCEWLEKRKEKAAQS